MVICAFLYLLSSFGTENILAQSTANQTVTAGDNIVLNCTLAGLSSYPGWEGPPNLSTILTLEDLSGFNDQASIHLRLYWDSGKNLGISKVETDDAGDYKCSYSSIVGSHTVTLIVNNVTTPATTPGTPEDCCTVEKWCNILPIIGAIFVAIGILLNIIPLVLRKLECIEKHGPMLVIVGSILYVLGLILIIIGLIGGLSTDSCTIWWRIVLLFVAVILIILGVLYKLGYLTRCCRAEGAKRDDDNELLRPGDSVPVPQEKNPAIKFEDVLNPKVLKRLEKETGVKVMMYGKGCGQYGTYGDSKLHSDKPLHVSITSDRPEDVRKASDKIKAIIKDATAGSADGATHRAANSVEPRSVS